jgi:hypothetical protein
MEKERWGAFSFLLDKTVEEHIAETDRRRAAWQSKASEEISACMSELADGERPSQKARVLRMLREARAAQRAVHSTEFMEAGIPKFKVRIRELQRAGFGIGERDCFHGGGCRCSRFRLTFDQERDEQ